MSVIFLLFLMQLNFNCFPNFNNTTIETIQQPLGESLILEFDSNVATGKSWVLVEPVDSSFLRLANKTYIPKSGDLDGNPGKDRFEFTPLQKGTTYLKFAYHFPWESDIPKDAKRKKIKIIIN